MTYHSNSLKKLNPIPYLNSLTPISHKPPQTSTAIVSHLINHFISIKTLSFTNFIHTQFVKLGLNTNTFFANRLLHAYTKFGSIDDTLRLFHDTPHKNLFTWNVLVVGLFKFGDFEKASVVFDEMPQRDVVTWNSMISGYAAMGWFGYALGVFRRMQNEGVKPSAFTFSIVMSCVGSASQAREVHGSVIRSGVDSSSIVVCNCLIDMYGKLQLIDYAYAVFSAMKELDVVSWNSLISSCAKSGYVELAWVQFCLMMSCGYSPDQCTVSTVIAVCSDLRALEKDWRIPLGCLKRYEYGMQ